VNLQNQIDATELNLNNAIKNKEVSLKNASNQIRDAELNYAQATKERAKLTITAPIS